MAKNGQLPNRALAPIAGGGKLEKSAAKAWNAFARACREQHGITVEVTDSYRPLGKPGDLAAGRWSQWAAWERYQQGGNLAARPGSSNHGLGLAVDCPPATQAAIARHGAPFGWQKKWSDAPSEGWHFKWAAEHADKKLVKRWSEVRTGDTIQRGDRGTGVLTLTSLLKRHGFWPYPGLSQTVGPLTARAIRRFQRAKGLTADGIVGPATWRALRAEKPSPPKPKPKPSKPTQPKNPNARLFADIFSGEEHFDAKAYAAAGHTLIALKASEGATYKDPPFAARAQAARKAGLAVFAYHFARPGNGNSPEAEAQNFVATVKSAGAMRLRDRLVLDWEDPKFQGQRGDEWVAAFIKEVKRLGLKVRVLYSGGWYLPGTLHRWPTDGDKPLRYWHAAYTSDPAKTCPSFARPYLWALQYTDGTEGPLGPKKAAGIGACDMNRLV